MAVALAELEEHLKQFVHDQDKLLESRLKLWIMSAVIMQVVPLVAIAFFLGGIYQNLNSSMAVVQAQQTELVRQAKWMDKRERWEADIELWASQVNPPLRLPKGP